MLVIKYKNYHPKIEDWKTQLEALVMAHQIVEDDMVEGPILKNTNEVVIGERAISKYIDDLEIFQTAWFACSCG